MKTFSIMETQHNLALVLREVAAGHEVGITRHKKLVARLLPPAVPTAIELPDFVARARNVWHAGWRGTGTRQPCASRSFEGNAPPPRPPLP
jgi:antitoxin (DNA-binding transcriptional repressor) of toxin-antitoxin stability system